MKHFALSVTLILGLAGAAAAEPIVGLWNAAPPDADGSLHVEIKPCGPAFCGYIAAAFDGSGQRISDYEHQGKRMIWDMTADGGGAYSGGKIWAADDDKTYGSKMQVEGNVLVVRGCVAGGLICREGGRWGRLK